MIKLDINFINTILSNKSNKDVKCYKDPNLFTQLHLSISNLFTFYSTKCSKYEVAQIINSNNIYLKTKGNTVNSSIKYKPGQVVIADLGLNFNNLSYKHPCIILKDIKDKVFIVPCSSRDTPINCKTNKLESGYLIGTKDDGFQHNTTIILKEASCIDKSQIIHSIKVNKKFKRINPKFLKKINDNLFSILFESYNYKLNKIEHNYNKLLIQYEQLQEEIAVFKTNEDE